MRRAIETSIPPDAHIAESLIVEAQVRATEDVLQLDLSLSLGVERGRRTLTAGSCAELVEILAVLVTLGALDPQKLFDDEYDDQQAAVPVEPPEGAMHHASVPA